MRATKKEIWEHIFEIGKQRNFSKEECRKRINKILSQVAPEYRNELRSLKTASAEFERHEKPLWMEPVEKLVEWKKTAKDRCVERTLAAEMLIKECNGDLDKLDKEQQPGLKWVSQLNKEIARRINVREEALKEKDVDRIPQAKKEDRNIFEPIYLDAWGKDIAKELDRNPVFAQLINRAKRRTIQKAGS